MTRALRRIRPYALAVAILGSIVTIHWFAGERPTPVGPGAPAPEFSAVDLAGAPVALSDLAGQVVLLNIWATWCPPCRDEMPSMQRLYDLLAPAGLRIVAVSIDAQQGALDAAGRAGGDVAAFVDELELTFDIWLDPSGGIQRTYRTTGVPESFVVDRSGTIVRRIAGPTEWDDPTYVTLFRRLLQDSTAVREPSTIGGETPDIE
jgi:thiol-disulfide isomerase/thioredoxin